MTPSSALTVERPHIWTNAVELATSITGYVYVPKAPLTMCGGGFYYSPPPARMPPEAICHLVQDVNRDRVAVCGETIADGVWRSSDPRDATCQPCLDVRIRAEEDARRAAEEKAAEEARLAAEEAAEERKAAEAAMLFTTRPRRAHAPLDAKPRIVIPVPEGAMEWLLHEIGHWVAATPEERLLPDYGYGQEAKGVGKARELQAWVFEEIVLAPWGQARDLCPPPHRGGVAFTHTATPDDRRRIDLALNLAPQVDIDQWRALYAAWIEWELTRSRPSWCRDS